MATRADPTLAGAAALEQGFVRASEAAANRRRYQTTIGPTTYTVITITENYTSAPGQKHTCAITQEPGDAFTTAAVAAIVGGMPTQAEGDMSVWQMVEEAGVLTLLRSGEGERALAASRAHTLYEVTVIQTAAENVIIYVHW
jgi:hypothetical protein